MLDDIDRRLLRRLQDDPTMTHAMLADATRVPQATVARRLDRLKSQGVLRATRAIVDWKALGFAVEVSLRVTLDKTAPRAFDDHIAAARKVPEVTEIQTFLGRVDVRLAVVARDMADYQRLYRDSILTLPHIAEIEALMQVARVAARPGLPL